VCRYERESGHDDRPRSGAPQKETPTEVKNTDDDKTTRGCARLFYILLGKGGRDVCVTDRGTKGGREEAGGESRTVPRTKKVNK
jgi:hypothetical protein